VDILKEISDRLSNNDVIEKLGKSVGADETQVRKLAQLGLPTIMHALERNSNTHEGRQALSNAIDKHQNDNVDDLDQFFNSVDKHDGSKMLQHIFSGKTDTVLNNLSKKTGMDNRQVAGIMTQLAPFLMGTLGKQKRQHNLDFSGISDLIGSALGKNRGNDFIGILTNILDKDDDGSIADDVGDLLGGFLKK